jgi:site-specific DNA-methyltransferase (cytosine-N4-specific)
MPVKSSIEPLLWIGPDPDRAQADNRRVLTPYTTSGRRAIARDASNAAHPSGVQFGARSFVDRGGAIPNALIVAPNGGSTPYRRAERAAGREPHPATMPEAVADFGIRLTTSVGDLVFDPFAGSGTTLAVAERLGRRWIGSERSRHYIDGAALRFTADGVAVRPC